MKFDRKAMKKQAKHVLRKHYWLLVVLCLVGSVLGAEVNTSMESVGIMTPDTVEDQVIENEGVSSGVLAKQPNVIEELETMIQGDAAKSDSDATTESTTDGAATSDDADDNAVLGHTRGVFASVVNQFTSGAIVAKILSGINRIVGSQHIAIMLMIAGALILAVAFWALFINLYNVIVARIFLESRTYEKVRINRVLFLVRVRRWMRTAWTMLVMFVYRMLWFLTIIGGLIKTYSYRMVPYIVAENPNLKANEAITLSRKMMNGHKFQCFLYELSFIGWTLLGFFTFGLVELFFTNPYRNAFIAEFYAYLRKDYIDNQKEGYEAFNDKYLFELADDQQLNTAYADAIEEVKKTTKESIPLTGVKGFIANVFGVTFFSRADEKEYEENEARILRMATFKDAIEKKTYPTRLSAIPEKQKRDKTDHLRYMRHYTIWSLILMYFIFALIGWIWEVSLHLITDGVFVNRGVLHGPWLPIYGTGGVLILVVLNKFRKNPAIEFVATIILCGCVEYFTSYYLEMTHNGQKWWDYSGYFLNLNGRICAEGLLVFGLGGMAIVYVLAPLIDNKLRKIPYKIVIPICAVLLGAFAVDQAYSSKHPNTGKGITDYDSKVPLEIAQQYEKTNLSRTKTL